MSTLTAEDFDRLVRAERDGLVRYARQFVNSHDDAEEAVQNALTVAWETRDSQHTRNPTGRLTVLTRFAAMQIRNKQGRYELIGGWEDEYGFEFVARLVQPSPVQRCRADWRTRQRVRAALNLLPPYQRKAVELYALRGLTLDQVAERLGVTPATVGDYWRKALRRIEGDPAIRKVAAVGRNVHERGVGSEIAEAFRTRPELLAALPHCHRRVIRLRYLKGLSVAEVARLLGIKPKSVEKSTAKANQKARQVLAALSGSGSAVTA